MFGNRVLLLSIAAFLACLLGSASSYASVKCQCNNGTITQDMGADPDDDDVEEACNDACSMSGGGQVWNAAADDDDDDDDVVVRPGGRHSGSRARR